MNSMPIAITIKPIILDNALIPEAPIALTMIKELLSIRKTQSVEMAMAPKMIIIFSKPVCSWLKVINNEIVPGPAIIGRANGVREISDLVIISSFTEALPIPLDLAKAPVNKENPEKVIINPPAIFNELRVIPKNIKMNLPAKKEINNMTKTLKEAQKAILFLSSVVCSFVNPTNIGTVPRGFITEINAPQMMKNKSIFTINNFQAKLRLKQVSTIIEFLPLIEQS